MFEACPPVRPPRNAQWSGISVALQASLVRPSLFLHPFLCEVKITVVELVLPIFLGVSLGCRE